MRGLVDEVLLTVIALAVILGIGWGLISSAVESLSHIAMLHR